jgi:hypothetical protein
LCSSRGWKKSFEYSICKALWNAGNSTTNGKFSKSNISVKFLDSNVIAGSKLILSIKYLYKLIIISYFQNRLIMRGFLKEFSQPIIDIGDKVVTAAVQLYGKIAEDLLPTPEKSHYIFNLRDLSKCIQGILQADANVIIEVKQMLR